MIYITGILCLLEEEETQILGGNQIFTLPQRLSIKWNFMENEQLTVI